MYIRGVIPTHIEGVTWQDYRGAETGMIVYYNSDPVSELPIREVPEELPSDVSLDPNYETGSFGFYGCKHAKVRSYFVKNKMRYLFFMTRYAGTNPDHTDDLMITGYYRIKQTTNVQKLHIRYLDEYSCINEDSCIALRANEVHFVSVEDAFKVDEKALAQWEYTSRVTRQTKVMLNEENTLNLLQYLQSKENITDQYNSETQRLMPEMDDEEEDDEE